MASDRMTDVIVIFFSFWKLNIRYLSTEKGNRMTMNAYSPLPLFLFHVLVLLSAINPLL